MTLPLRYAITDGDKNGIGVVCPPFMSSACHLSCTVRLNMRVNSRSHERFMQRSPSGRTVQAVLQTTLLRFCVLLYCSKALCGAFAVGEVPVIAFFACHDASHVRTHYSCAVGQQSSCLLSQSAAVNAPSEPSEPSQDNADLDDGDVDSESEDQAEEEESDSDEPQEEELSSADVHLADAAKAAITLQEGAVLGSLRKQKGEKWIQEAGDALAVLDGQRSSSLRSYLESGPRVPRGLQTKGSRTWCRTDTGGGFWNPGGIGAKRWCIRRRR